MLKIDGLIIKKYKTIELFAGAGGLALGFEKAGFEPVLLNELDKFACKTLRKNRPLWNVVEGDVRELDFTKYLGKIDLLTGGFPCQSFSHAGKRLGFEDARGTLFFEFARAVKECEPTIFLAENVKGLLTHDNGRTLKTVKNIIREIGYELIVEPMLLNAMYYKVAQKRERLFLIGVRRDIMDKISANDYVRPLEHDKITVLKDVLMKGELYHTDVPPSCGPQYPKSKREIMQLVPSGGNWISLPIEIQKTYLGKSYFASGGKTGTAKRPSYNEPCLTLTCSPSQKQTERCHPVETRPLTVREYARIQSFPDEWAFEGSMSAQYRQIGNAVPVNLAYAVAHSLLELLETIEAKA